MDNFGTASFSAFKSLDVFIVGCLGLDKVFRIDVVVVASGSFSIWASFESSLSVSESSKTSAPECNLVVARLMDEI